MRKSMGIVGVCLYFSAPGVAVAGPLIAAQTVLPMCQVQGTTVLSVSVVLNGVTSNFYGTTLRYHFVPIVGGVPNPAGTIVLASPTPAASPVRLAVAPGAYELIISDNQMLTPSASQSPRYPVTVPANLVTGFGQRRACGPILVRTQPRNRTH